MNRLFLIVGVVLLIVVLVFLNQGIHKASPTDEDLQRQAQEQAQKQTPTVPTPPASGKPAGASVALPPDETVGDPAKARHHIEVGWSYDEENEANPAMLTGPLQAVRDYVKQSGGSVSAEIVNLDIPIVDRPPAARDVTHAGIGMDGRAVLAGHLSAMHASAPDITKALDAVAGKK